MTIYESISPGSWGKRSIMEIFIEQNLTEEAQKVEILLDGLSLYLLDLDPVDDLVQRLRGQCNHAVALT